MRIVLMGPPGAGKGTQAAMLARNLAVLHISSGDLFRIHQQRGTALGLKAQEYMAAGLLVPDEVTIAMVLEEVFTPIAEKGFILDGFPRNVNQAQALDQALEGRGKVIDHGLSIYLPTKELMKRLLGRMLCPKCRATYNASTLPPKKKGICDQCGAPLQKRSDDNSEAVERRLHVYQEESKPLVDYYDSQDKLVQIDGWGTVEEVGKRLLKSLGHSQPWSLAIS